MKSEYIEMTIGEKKENEEQRLLDCFFFTTTSKSGFANAFLQSL